MRCVICGREYKRNVTAAHLRKHRISKKRYDETAAKLTDEMWEFYWTNEHTREVFPDPVGKLKKATPAGFKSFKESMESPRMQAKLAALKG